SAEGAAIAPFAWSPAAGQQKITLRNGEQNPGGLIYCMSAQTLRHSPRPLRPLPGRPLRGSRK
ncbi:hypothetical protein, partial [Tatumella sp. JGM16]|uniref:hypothetical protein n=1 Tax=Tatumella sp. JGM16 TaxID=2799798 RepID=UPI001BAE6FBE